jgi:hypothetical protein
VAEAGGLVGALLAGIVSCALEMKGLYFRQFLGKNIKLFTPALDFRRSPSLVVTGRYSDFANWFVL